MPRRALVHYAAASLLAELKHLAAPVSIHLPPLDLDVEDHGVVTPSVVFTTRRALDAARHDPDLRGADGDRPDGGSPRACPSCGSGTRAGLPRACKARLVEGCPPRACPGSSRRGRDRAALTTLDSRRRTFRRGPPSSALECDSFGLDAPDARRRSALLGRHESVTASRLPARVPPLASSVFCVTAIMRAPGAISTT